MVSFLVDQKPGEVIAIVVTRKQRIYRVLVDESVGSTRLVIGVIGAADFSCCSQIGVAPDLLLAACCRVAEVDAGFGDIFGSAGWHNRIEPLRVSSWFRLL